MKAIIFLAVIFSITSLNSCKDKDPKVTKTLELSEEMKAYFVDYEVGTKWIYQDTVNPNVYDTIELVSKDSYDVDKGNGTLRKGFELLYKPKKSKDFIVRVGAGNNNSCNAKLDPMVTAAGAVVFENYNGVWAEGLVYYDSLNITGSWFYSVIHSSGSNMYVTDVSISKNKGIIGFWRYKNDSWALENYFKLIKILKP
jgi:hypothetical protein